MKKRKRVPGRAAFWNLSEPEKRCERVRRSGMVLRAIRHMNTEDIRRLFQAALILDGEIHLAKQIGGESS